MSDVSSQGSGRVDDDDDGSESDDTDWSAIAVPTSGDSAPEPDPEFLDMVQEAVERGVVLHELKPDQEEVVFRYPRSWFTELALQGLCWSEREGDIRLHAAIWVNTGSKAPRGMPRTWLEGTKSRVLFQMEGILKEWRSEQEEEWRRQKHREKKLFLWRLHEHVDQKLRKLPNLCLACLGERRSAYPRWRPLACRDEKCQVFVRELIKDPLSIITMAPEAVEVVLAFFSAACYSPENRQKLLFVLRSQHFSEFLKEKSYEGADWQKLGATLAKMPELTTLPKDPRQLVGALYAYHPLLVKLVRWILNSAAGFLVKVEDPAFLEAVGVGHVFLFHPDSHEKLERFDAVKGAKGLTMTYAFHGSSKFNWFTILRDGLVVASNTELMSTGAARGAGIYFGKTFSVSQGYCGSAQTGIVCALGSEWQCVGLCEIAHTRKEDKGDMIVVTDAERVVLRALLIFTHIDICKMSAAELGSALEGLALYRELHNLAPLAVQVAPGG